MAMLRHGLLLAALALVCAASVAHAMGLDCTIARAKYWPTLMSATKCKGNNHLWAFNVCWRKDAVPDASAAMVAWDIAVCPAGCSLQTDPRKAAGCAPIPVSNPLKPLPWKMCINGSAPEEDIAAGFSQPFQGILSLAFANIFKGTFMGATGVFADTEFCLDSSRKSSGLALGFCPAESVPANEDTPLPLSNGVGFFPLGMTDGEPVEAPGANIWISDVDVVASGAGTLIADQFEGVTGQVSRKVAKGLSKVKLQMSSSPSFKVHFPTNTEGQNGISTLVWAPTTPGTPLTIKCMSGTYIPAFTPPS